MLEKLPGLALFGLLILGCSGCQNPVFKSRVLKREVFEQVGREEILAQREIPVFTYAIVKKYPHDVTSYTELDLSTIKILLR